MEARRSRLLAGALLGTVLLVVVIAVVVVFAGRTPTKLDGSTPAGVVQRYAQAVVEGDVTTAITYLVPSVGDACRRIPASTGDRRVTLLGTTEHAGSARVTVLITTTSDSGILGADQYESEGAFDLQKTGGRWRISTTPWELAVCEPTGAGS